MAAVIRLTVAGVRRRGVGQIAALLLVTALASAAVVAGIASRRSTAAVVDETYTRLGRPDLVLYGTAEALTAAALDPDIVDASRPARIVGAETLVGGEPVAISVAALDETERGVGAPRLVSGRWPTADAEIVVERSIVVEGAMRVGQMVSLTAGQLGVTTGGPPAVRVRVVGTVVELSDCLYLRKLCDPLRAFGRLALVERLAGTNQVPTYRASYHVRNPDIAAFVGARVAATAGPTAIKGQNTWPDTRGDILALGEIFGAIVSGLGAFMLVAAAFVIAGATAARLVARRKALGLLRAIGFAPRQIAASLITEHLALGALGVLAGWLVGSLAAPGLSDVDRVFVTSAPATSWQTLAVAFALVEAVLVSAVVAPATRAAREPASAVLRDVPPALTGGRRVARLARRLGASALVVAGVRRALARRTHATLAAGAIGVAVVSLIVSVGFIRTVDATASDPARVGDPFDFRVLSPDLDDAVPRVEALRGVASVHTERDVEAVFGKATYRANLLGGNPATLGYRIEEGRRLDGPGEAIAGYGLLRAIGARVGDRVSATVAGVPLQLTIVGRYSETADRGKVIQFLESTLPPRPPTPLAGQLDVTLAPGVDAAQLAMEARAALGPNVAVVQTETDDIGLGAIRGTLVGFALLLVLVAAANLFATTMAATRERARAIGVFRTLGSTTAQLVSQTAAGTGVLGFAAALVGVPLGAVIFDRLSGAIATSTGVGPGLPVAPSFVQLAVLIPGAMVIAAASGALAAATLARKSAAELTRYE